MDAVVVAPPVVGTSAEVLQHYLTAGIEVQDITTRARHTISGLNLDGVAKIDLRDEHGRIYGSTGRAFSRLLPVLRPFSALCDPLPDETVPSVEVLKLNKDIVAPDAFDWDNIKWLDDGSTLIAVVPLHHSPQQDQFYLPKDWTCLDWNQVEYLRSQHFAVGLEPHQFIVK